MAKAFHSHLTTGVALAGAGVIAIAQLPIPQPDSLLPDVALAAHSYTGEVEYVTFSTSSWGSWGSGEWGSGGWGTGGWGTGNSGNCGSCGSGGSGGDDGDGTGDDGDSTGNGGSTSDGISIPISFPNAGAFLGAFGTALDGLPGAGGTILDLLGDGTTSGAALLTDGLTGIVQLKVAALAAAVNLVTSGASGGADAFGQALEGLPGAIGGFDVGAEGSVGLPGFGTFLDAFGNLSAGLTGAGGSFLDLLGNQITDGTGILTDELAGGASLAASSLIAAACLLSAGISGGADAFGQAVWGLSGAAWDLNSAAWDLGGSGDGSVTLPGLNVLGSVATGLTGAGASFLDLLGDQVTGGASILTNGIQGGANLAASSLLAAACLLGSGAAGGADSLAQAIWGLSGAAWDLNEASWDLSGDGSISVPGADSLLDAFGSVAGGLTGSGATFLDTLGDQLTGGTNILSNGIAGGAHFGASSLVAAACLLTAGVTGGANSFAQLISGLSSAVGDLDVDINSDSTVSLPGSAAVTASLSHVTGGLSGASGTFLDTVGNQASSGTAVLNSDVRGGAHLTAESVVDGADLVTDGASGGASSLNQAVNGLAGAVTAFNVGTSALPSPTTLPSPAPRLVSIPTPPKPAVASDTAVSPKPDETSTVQPKGTDGGPSSKRTSKSADAGPSSKQKSEDSSASASKSDDSGKSSKASSGGKHRASNGKGKHAK